MNNKFVLLAIAAIIAGGHSASLRDRRQAGFASLQQPVTVETSEKPTETTPFEQQETTQSDVARHLTTAEQKMEAVANDAVAQVDKNVQMARAELQQAKEQLVAEKAQKQQEAAQQTSTEQPQTEATTVIVEKKIETTQFEEEQKNEQTLAPSSSEFPTTDEQSQKATEQPKEEPKEKSTPELNNEEEPVQTTSEQPQEESTPFEQQEARETTEMPREEPREEPKEEPKQENQEQQPQDELPAFKPHFQTTQLPLTPKILEVATREIRTTFYPLVKVPTAAPSTLLPIRPLNAQPPQHFGQSPIIQKEPLPIAEVA